MHFIAQGEEGIIGDDAPEGSDQASGVGSRIRIEEDKSLAKTSHYHWMNIEVDGARVGKMRVRASDETLTVYSIAIFPEFQRRGYAGKVIHTLQGSYKGMIADRVRDTARGFWRRMGFKADGRGSFVWQRSLEPHAARPLGSSGGPRAGEGRV